MTVTLEDIRAAAELLRGQVVDTPCLHSRTLSEITGAQVWLKFENHQFTASFKERGALVKLLSLSPEAATQGVVACSAGNHAQGVAYHASRLGIPAVIVMPRHTPFVKVEHTRRHGAEVILHGENFDEAKSHARELAATRGLTLVHPYDDEKVVAGQGTVALEMLAAHPQLDTLLVAIGGGGLIAGMATAAKALKPGIEVIGVETERFPSMYHAVRGTHASFGASTIAEGIAVKEPGRITRAIVERLVSDIVLVDEGDIEQAIVMLLEIEKTVVEGAGAAPLAACLEHPEFFAGREVGLVLSGGNIDPRTLAVVTLRGLANQGRLNRVRVELDDLPGRLALVSKVIAEAAANVVQVDHDGLGSTGARSTVLDLRIDTLDAAHAQEVIDRLHQAGIRAELLPW